VKLPVSKVIALFNQAGGVCKTTLTLNLGYHLHLLKQRVLIIDLDPQASLTTFMGLEASELEQTVAEAILENQPFPIHSNLHGLDLIPSNLSLSAAELKLTSVMSREGRLRRALTPILDQYDFILIDCPPSLGILSVLALAGATHVLIPVQTHYKAYKGTELLLETIRQVREHVNPDLAIAGVVPTLHVANAAQDKLILESIQQQLSGLGRVYPPIPRATAFADAVMAHLPLALYQPKHPSVKVLTEIATGLEAL
jgi:chromosome partitioning protein